MKSVLEVEWKVNPDESGLRAYYIPGSVMRDSRLSCKAKVVWSYMNSRPSGWDFSSARMAESFKEGRKPIQGAIRELEGYGYLKRRRMADGRISYNLVYDSTALTEEEAQECLAETFPDYYVTDEEFVCINDCIQELMRDGMDEKLARKTGEEFWKWCDSEKLGQSRHAWTRWKSLYVPNMDVMGRDSEPLSDGEFFP